MSVTSQHSALSLDPLTSRSLSLLGAWSCTSQPQFKWSSRTLWRSGSLVECSNCMGRDMCRMLLPKYGKSRGSSLFLRRDYCEVRGLLASEQSQSQSCAFSGALSSIEFMWCVQTSTTPCGLETMESLQQWHLEIKPLILYLARRIWLSLSTSKIMVVFMQAVVAACVYWGLWIYLCYNSFKINTHTQQPCWSSWNCGGWVADHPCQAWLIWPCRPLYLWPVG